MNTAKLADYRAYDVESKLFHYVYADASWYGDRDKRIQAVCGATAKGLPVPTAVEGARLERLGATPCPECELHTDRRSIWTIAFRKRRANRFQRVTNWSGSWDDAVKMAGLYAKSHPELEIYYVITLDAEKANPGSEDNGNVMVESGKRIRIVDNAELSEEIISEFAAEFDRTENKGRPGHFYKSVPGTDDHIICTHKSHVTNGAAYRCAYDAIWANAAHADEVISAMDTIDQAAMVDVLNAVADSGQEEFTYLADTVDALKCATPDGSDSKITKREGCTVCETSYAACSTCTLAFLVTLFPVLRKATLPDYPVESLFAETAFDCYA